MIGSSVDCRAVGSSIWFSLRETSALQYLLMVAIEIQVQQARCSKEEIWIFT